MYTSGAFSGWLWVAVCGVCVLWSVTGAAQPEAVLEMDAEEMPAGMGTAPVVTIPPVVSDGLKALAALSYAVPGVRVELSPEEWDSLLNEECEECRQTAQRMKIGISKPVDIPFPAAEIPQIKGPLEGVRTRHGYVLRTTDGRLGWVTRIEAPDAGGMRVHFDQFNLPAGTEVYLFSEEGECFGPYIESGPIGLGAFWSNTLSSSVGYVLCVSPSGNETFAGISFQITEVSVLRPDFSLARIMEETSAKDSKQLASCIQDASCYGTDDWSGIDRLRRAVAHMIFQVDGGTAICSGGLVNDRDPTTWIPYFLTANHCLSTQASANSLECVWDFMTRSCNSGYTDWASTVGFPRTLGAQLLATHESTDFSLLQLTGSLPAGRVFLGWTTAPPLNGQTLYRVSHPKGAQQSYSTQSVVLHPADTCPGLPVSNYVYSSRLIGSIDGGSSGSPVVNANNQIIGQLFGTCYEQGCGICSTGCFLAQVDGRFSVTYASIESWMGAPPRISTLSVNAVGAVGVMITSATGHGGVTNYTLSPTLGELVTLTAPAEAGGKPFTGWTGDVTSADFTIHFNLDGAYTVNATYGGNSLVLSVRSVGASGVPIDSATGQGGVADYTRMVPAGALVALRAPISIGIHDFTGWTGAVTGTETFITFSMVSDMEVTANYRLRTFTLAVDSVGTEAVNISSTTGHGGITNYTHTVPGGTDVTLTADDRPGCCRRFSQWTGDEFSTNTSVQFDMDQDKTLSAEYERCGCFGWSKSESPSGDLRRLLGDWLLLGAAMIVLFGLSRHLR